MIYEIRTNGKRIYFQTMLFKNLLLKSLIFFVIIIIYYNKNKKQKKFYYLSVINLLIIRYIDRTQLT